MPEPLLVEPIVQPPTAIIKAIGVGGGGGNAVGQMYREGIPGVRFQVCNTDAKALEDTVVPDTLQLGPGLGAGGRPEIGHQYAEDSLEKIATMFDNDIKMVFVTAGMGGGTGTGASPVIAREAKRRDILTIGVVTLPFLFEGKRVIDKALDGLDQLAREVDAMLVINNQRLCEIYSDFTVPDAFKRADDVLTTAVRSIVEIITMHGKVGLDFRDVNNVLKDGGVAIMSSGYGEGEGRITKAIENALYSPLLNNNDIYRSRKLILSITTSSAPDKALRMEEVNEIDNFTSHFRSDIETKWGLTFDESMGGRVKITILASGFNLYGHGSDDAPAEEDDDRKVDRRLRNYPELNRSSRHKRLRRRPKVFIYTPDTLDNPDVIAAIDASPTALRSTEALSQICAMVRPAANLAAEAGEPANGDAEGATVIHFDTL